MTYGNTTGVTEYGPCPYIAHYSNTVEYSFYIQLPSNVSLLNEYMCGPLNREGPLCGKCNDGYGTALYSYTLECSKCWEHGYGRVLYSFLELFPITVMYFLVVIFHIKATSSPLNAIAFMSQILVYTIRLNIPFHMYIENEVTGFPPFCVSSNIKNVHVLALEHLVAFFLILIAYECIRLHDNNCSF